MTEGSKSVAYRQEGTGLRVKLYRGGLWFFGSAAFLIARVLMTQ